MAGELQPAGGRPDDFALGAIADINATAGTASVDDARDAEARRADVPHVDGVACRDSRRAQHPRPSRRAAEGGGIPLSDLLRIEAASAGAQPLVFRRGVSTGNRFLPAADLRFSRTERVRLELPVDGAAKPGAGRVLDRTGQPVQVPVAVSERLDDATGQRWIIADVVLAPLAGGDYGIEVEVVGTATSQRIVSAIRVVR